MDIETVKNEEKTVNKTTNAKIIEKKHRVETREGKRTVKRGKKRLDREKKNTKSGQSKGKVKQRVKDVAWRLHDEAVGSDESLSQLVQARHKYQNVRRRYGQAKRAGRVTVKTGKALARGSYKIAKPTAKYSYKATKYTAKKAGKFSVRAGKATARTAIKASQRARQLAAKAAQQTAAFFAKAAAAIVTNPISWIAAGIGAIILLLVIIIASIIPSSVVQQNEFTLNQSWIQITKTDREKSTDEVDYWTDIDPILHYMNYRYGGEWEPDANWNDGTGGAISGFFGFNHYSDALNDIWLSLNEDKDDLKTMPDLYGANGKKDWMKFNKDDLEEYKELLEVKDETGYYPAYQELTSPFESPDSEEEGNSEVVITRRYGYTSSDSIDPTTTIQAQSGQKIYAPMDGKVTVTKKDLLGKDTETTNLIISSSDARLILYDVRSLRVKDGQEIKEGDELGQVKTNGIDLKIAYAKKYGEVDNSDSNYLKDIKNEKSEYGFKEKDDIWVLVNPGFYFQFVSYTQKTSVVTTYNLGGDLGDRINQTWGFIKKYYPKATKNGAAAMMGNFMIESSINPKRAEGDYLNPPVGASGSSWDDENWLNIDGPTIYNGRYPNILRRGLGLGQWTDTRDGSTRHTLLLEYAKKKGKKWYDLELQIDFIFNGDSPYYTNYAKQILGSNDDVADLTKKFLVYWEGNPGDKLIQRQDGAKQVLAQLNNGGGSYNGKKALSAADFSKALNETWNQSTGVWQPNVGHVANAMTKAYGVPNGQFMTYQGHSPSMDLAIDFMINGDYELGDSIAAFFVANFDELNVDYIIWGQKWYKKDMEATTGGANGWARTHHPAATWSLMEDRGNVTQNHGDHVHVSFKSGTLNKDQKFNNSSGGGASDGKARTGAGMSGFKGQVGR